MPAITLAQAEAQLAAYLDAEQRVLTGQSYEIAGRKLTRADLEAIQTGIATWNRRVKDLEAEATAGAAGGARMRTIVFNDR